MLTQCATGAVIFAAGDLVAQQLVEKRGLKGHDVSLFSAWLREHERFPDTI